MLILIIFYLLLSQFADDTDLFLKCTVDNLNEVANTLTKIEDHTGLKPNYRKTTITRLGACKDNNTVLETEKDYVWSSRPPNILGVWVADTANERISLNFDPLITKVSNVLDIWSHRSLTLMGRATVVNTLVESLFVYRMCNVELLTDEYYQIFHSMISQFIWKKKRVRIKYESLQVAKQQGGLRLVNLKFKHMALLAQWAFKAQTKPFLHMCMYNALGPVCNIVWHCNLNIADVDVVVKQNSFWKDVLKSWCVYNFHIPGTAEEVKSQSLWLNSHIRIEGYPFYLGKALTGNLLRLSQIIENGHFIGYRELVVRFPDCGLSWLDYYALIDAIPQDWKVTLRRQPQAEPRVSNFERLSTKDKVTKTIYYSMIDDSQNLCERANTWNAKLGTAITTQDLHKLISVVSKYTISVKLRDFHYRLMTNILVFNVHLKRWNKQDNDKCVFCKMQVEDMVHTFYECAVVKGIWEDFWIHILNYFPDIGLKKSVANVLWSDVVVNRSHSVVNLLSLIVKQYLYRSRCLNRRPMSSEIFKEFKELQSIEYGIAYTRGKLKTHYKKWSSYHYDASEIVNCEVQEQMMQEYYG